MPAIVNRLKEMKVQLEKGIEQLDEKHKKILVDIESLRSQITAEAGDVIGKLKACEDCEKMQYYIGTLRMVHEANCVILLSLEEEQCDWNSAVAKFDKLQEMLTFVKDSKCRNFVIFLEKLVNTWKEKLTKGLEQAIISTLSEMGWPLHSTQMPSASKDSPMFERFQIFIKMYSKICFSASDQDRGRFEPETPVVSVLLAPFVKRFEFHFFGDSQTNSIEKPEWFFTQILTWIKLHRDHLMKLVQPLFEKNQKNIFIEFSRGLVGLAFRRLKSSLPEIISNDALFSHWIDETVVFEMEITSFGYPETQPRCIDAFAEDDSILNTWLRFAVQE